MDICSPTWLPSGRVGRGTCLYTYIRHLIPVFALTNSYSAVKRQEFKESSLKTVGNYYYFGVFNFCAKLKGIACIFSCTQLQSDPTVRMIIMHLNENLYIREKNIIYQLFEY